MFVLHAKPLANTKLHSSVGKNPPAMQETPVRSLGWEDSLEKEKATHSSILCKVVAAAAPAKSLQSCPTLA